MTSPTPAARPAPPLAGHYRTGVIDADTTGMPATCNVNIGGDNQGNDYDSGITWPCAYLNTYSPVPGDTVVLLGVPGAYVVLGALSSVGITYARYEGHRNATGVPAAAYDTPPSCPTSGAGSPWHTNTTFSDPNTWKRFTITKTCHIDFWCTFQCSGGTNPFAEMQLRVPTATSTGVTTATSTTPGGGLSQGFVSYSGLLVAGEVLDVILRNTGAVTTNLQYKIFCTFADASYSAAEQ
jgi:hypothetical protein